MGRKIDVNDIVSKIFKMLSEHEIVVLNYQHKEKSNHLYEIQFVETKNIYLASRKQILEGKVKDSTRIKQLKRIETEQKLKERNKLVKQAKNTCVIPDDLRDKNVLAVDLSSTSTGIAYSCGGKIVRWKTIKATVDDFRERAYVIVDEIVSILEKGKINTVILEDIYLGLNSNVLAILAEVRGMLTYHIKKLGIDLLLVPAVLWKNKFIDVPLHRNEQKEFMMRKFFEYTGEEADSDDAADSYMMLKACLGVF